MTRKRARELAQLRGTAAILWRRSRQADSAAEAAEAEYPGGVQVMWELALEAEHAAKAAQAQLDALEAESRPASTPAPLLRVDAPFRFIGESAGRDFLVEVDEAQARGLREAQLEAAIGGRFWRVRASFPVKAAEAYPGKPSQNAYAFVLAVGPTSAAGRAEALLRISPDQQSHDQGKVEEAEF